MTQNHIHNQLPTANALEIPIEVKNQFDLAYIERLKEYDSVPKLHFTDDEEQAIPELGRLRRRDRRSKELTEERELILAKAQPGPTDRRRLAEIDRRLASEQDALPLTPAEAQRRLALQALIEPKVKEYLEQSKVELLQAPKPSAFEGFTSITDEGAAEERGDAARVSLLALEEVRVLMNRLFGKYYRLKAFFEEYVVLKYDAERGVRRAQAGGNPAAGDAGGAEIKREYVSGRHKFIITVDDATFLRTKTIRSKDGRIVDEYTTIDLVASAFTIGRAVLRAALSDEAIEGMVRTHAGHEPAHEKLVRQLEEKRQGGAPHVVNLAAAPHGHGGHATVDEGLDFLAFMLVDPKQAQLVDAETGQRWHGTANKLLRELDPQQMYQLSAGATFTVPQGVLNYEFLYKDYDPKRRPERTGKDIRWNEKLGLWVGGGGTGAAIGSGLGAMVTPWPTLGALAGGVAGFFAGVRSGEFLNRAFAPLQLLRAVQGVWEEKSDFYYELAESEHDKKEVARIMAREEQISDRDARLKTLIATKNQVDMRRLLLADSETGDWSPWRQLLYLMHFDHKFIETGGREIGQEGYNFTQRLQRISNAKKRHGTKPNYYRAYRDPYGRTKYVLRDWDELDGHVRYEWESRSEREAQGVIQEQFELMNDTHGWVGVEARLGDDLDDPSSRGWCVGQVGDLRKYLGEDAAREFLTTLQTTIGAVDDRFLLKMDTYARNTIQRMASFIDKKFPGEHTKIIAKQAYTHYLTKLPKYESELDEDQETLQGTLDAKTVDDLVDDANVTDDTLVKLYRNVEFKTVDEVFPSIAKKKFPTLMIHGWLDKRLEHLREELLLLQQDRTNPLEESLVYEMEGLVDTLRESLTGAKSEAEVNEQIEQARLNLERLLNLPSIDEQQEFIARTWLIKLTETQPRVEKLVSFRAALRERLGSYRKEVKAGTPSQKQYGSALDQLTGIATAIELEEGDEQQALVERERDRVVALVRELITTAKERVGTDFPKGKTGSADALEIAKPGKFPEYLDKVVEEITKWYEGEKKKGKEKLIDSEVADAEILMGELQQFVRTAGLPEEVAGDRGARLRELKRRFVLISAVPEAEKALDDTAITHHGPNEMIARLKLALAALKVEKGDEEWRGGKKGKEEKPPKEDES